MNLQNELSRLGVPLDALRRYWSTVYANKPDYNGMYDDMSAITDWLLSIFDPPQEYPVYILEHTQDENLGEVFRMSDGRSVYVNDYTIGFVGHSPSNVDYYYEDERGYGCTTEREAAIVFASEFPAQA